MNTHRRFSSIYSIRALASAGIQFEPEHNGCVLKLRRGDKQISYWPTTGLWWVHGNRNKKRGIHKLVAFMKAPA